MPKQTPEEYQSERARVLAALSTGQSREDVGRAFGLSRSKVDRYFRSAKRIGASYPAAEVSAPAANEPSGAPKPCAAREPALGQAPAPAASPPPAPAPSASPPPAVGPVSDSDTLRVLIELQQEQIRLMRESREVGNLSAAQKFGRDAAGLSNTIARMQKLGQDEADVLRISRADIAAARLAFDEKLRSLLDRPILCAHCGRALSVEWGEGK